MLGIQNLGNGRHLANLWAEITLWDGQKRPQWPEASENEANRPRPRPVRQGVLS
ncbi:hypothetical protein CYB_2805 [Synechococcus sp. JA-2-3B'a(2-13)]|nr:hypothetical protein CYB_2805 [Synechococcus sp. JA-2-3B'a(2-13)]